MAGTWEGTGHPGVERQPIHGTERYRYRARFRDARGKVTSKTFHRLKDARDYLGDTRLRRRAGTPPDTSRTSKTLQEFWEHFQEKHRPRVSPSTWASYEHRWRNYVRPALGDRRIGSLRRSDIEDVYTEVQEEKSLDTRRKVQQVVHLVLAAAVEAEWIVKNPADNIHMPGAIAMREPRALTETEVEKLANEVPDRYRALVWMFAETGARPGELLALRVKNLNGLIRIVEATVEVSGRKITRQPKTKKSIRNVPISPRLRRELDDHFAAGFADRSDPNGYVFTSDRGGQLSQSNVRNRILKPAAERVGIEGFTTYDFRHTAISLWLMRGLSPWEVSRMVGHSTTAMIEQRYGHLYEHELQAKIDGLPSLR